MVCRFLLPQLLCLPGAQWGDREGLRAGPELPTAWGGCSVQAPDLAVPDIGNPVSASLRQETIIRVRDERLVRGHIVSV